MSSSQARSEWRERRTKIIYDYAKQYDLSVVELNSGYQLRINNILDIYPTNGRWHILFTSERGDWHLDKGDLNKIFKKAQNNTGVNKITVHDVDIANPNFDFGGDDEPITIQPYRQEYNPQNITPKKWPYGKPKYINRKWWQFWRKR